MAVDLLLLFSRVGPFPYYCMNGGICDRSLTSKQVCVRLLANEA